MLWPSWFQFSSFWGIGGSWRTCLAYDTAHTWLTDPKFARSSSAPPTPEKGPVPGIYGKDPQIYGQQEPGLVSPREPWVPMGRHTRNRSLSTVRLTVWIGIGETSSSNSTHRCLFFHPLLSFLVSHPVRGRFFFVQTNLPNFNGTTIVTSRARISNFNSSTKPLCRITHRLSFLHIPFSQTSLRQTTKTTGSLKIMLQRWITPRVWGHDFDTWWGLRAFVESDFGYQPTLNRSGRRLLG